MTQLLNIDSRIENNCCIITLKGEIDAHSAKLLDQYIATSIEGPYKNVLLDFNNLEYISSAGIGILMYFAGHPAKHTKLILFNVNSKVKSVFDLLSLDQYLMILSNEEATSIINEK